MVKAQPLCAESDSLERLSLIVAQLHGVFPFAHHFTRGPVSSITAKKPLDLSPFPR